VAVLALAACQSRTELMVGVATDLSAPGVLDEVRFELSRAGTGVPQITETWPISGTSQPFNLPGSYGIYSDGEALPVEIVLTGYKAGSRVVSRTARMTLVEGETLFYRMGLTAGCSAMPGACPAGTDCVEGSCKAIEIPPKSLPAFDPELVTHVTCQSAATYISTESASAMPMLPGAAACPSGQCAEGTCLMPVADLCGCQATEQCVDGVCVGVGALRVTLRWDAATDVDLHVLTPTGTELSFSNPTGDSGMLDVDDYGSGTLVENVFFTMPPVGGYQVWALNYTGTLATPFTIEVVTPKATLGQFAGQLPASMTSSQHYSFTYSGGS
jgi:hypothetical protein